MTEKDIEKYARLHGMSRLQVRFFVYEWEKTVTVIRAADKDLSRIILVPSRQRR